MNKSRFNQKELATIARHIGTNMTMRINKCGNIDIEYKKGGIVHFNIYKRENGYWLRRRLFANCTHGTYLHNNRPFPTIKDAMLYFADYKERCFGRP